MKFIKLILSLAITGALIYSLNTRFIIGSNGVPPLGKFLDPFHGFWQNAESDSIPFDINVSLPNLKDSVTVHYDELGIPHIFAQNNHDLFMAQGYVVAQNRLWQMDFQTYAAAGRLSELVGEIALDLDRLQRRKGMLFGADNTRKQMESNPQLKEYVEAYSMGVNAYINSLSYKHLPIEYKLLAYEPEKWSTVKSALLLQLMIDDLTGYDKDLQNTNAYNLMGAEEFERLYPQWPAGIDPVARTSEDLPYEPLTRSTPDSLQVIKTFMTKVHNMPDPDNGSNNWAVAGWKSKSGKAILASDMHLGLNAPSLWFIMQLSSPSINVMGFALTGNVGIVSGFNQNVSWAFTNVARDHRDWYKIKFTDDSKAKYIYGDENLEIKRVNEYINIRDGDTYVDTVLYTHYGPIVYDDRFLSNNGKDHLALKWIGHYPSRVQESLVELNRAKDYEGYLKALEKWDAPAQHVAFASDKGEVSIRVQGLLPLNFDDQGRYIMDGSNPIFEWGEFIPTEHYAHEYNPERGFISSANQHSADQNYPYEMVWKNMEHYRNRRINRVLNDYDSGSVTPQDMMSLQNDNYGIRPEEYLPYMLDSIGQSDHMNVLGELRAWDYVYEVDKIAPTYFEAWAREFRGLLWDEFYNNDLPVSVPSRYHTIWMLKNDFPDAYIDVKGTEKVESLSDLLQMSLDSALVRIEKWKERKGMEATWGNYKGTSIIHLSRLAPFSTYNIQVNGESDAVNSTKPNHGPSQRIVVEMSSPPRAWAVLPGGQSGNPGNPLFDNMIPLWRDGEYIKLNYMQPSDLAKDQFFTQKLNNN
ncbi:MAG: penicillin acylase family protein [Bacteroidota bacterium]